MGLGTNRGGLVLRLIKRFARTATLVWQRLLGRLACTVTTLAGVLILLSKQYTGRVKIRRVLLESNQDRQG